MLFFLLVLIDVFFTLNIEIFHSIFLLGFAIYEQYNLYLKRKIVKNSNNIFTFKNSEWYFAILPWIILIFIFFRNTSINLFFYTKAILVMIVITFTYIREAYNIFVINQKSITNLRTNKSIKFSDITGIYKLTNKIRIESSSLEIIFDGDKILNKNLSELEQIIEHKINNKA
jgi:hypothetical protein